ncbi:g10148 [Coccomyxa viridis]|uniref:G10148 protein n=1 Tax=Coccomyxa viridis TaxID=1274662 RepID=A0ABP1G4L5_9CHLO
MAHAVNLRLFVCRTPVRAEHHEAKAKRSGVTRASASGSSFRDASDALSQAQPEKGLDAIPEAGGGSGLGGGGLGSRGGRGGGGGDDGFSGRGGEGDYEASLRASGKSLDSLPADMAAAVAAGKVSQEILQRYLAMSEGLLAPLMKLGGFRERLLADPGFLVKVGIEVGIGIFTKSTAEYAKRGEDFNKELDFVLANVMMALIADFMLVWLPAPTLSYKPKSGVTKTGLAGFFANCPENAFQRVPQGYKPFTPLQRSGAVIRNGAKLLGVGFGASLIGVSITNALIFLRQQMDPSWSPQNAPQDVVRMSAAYGSYMAISSNLRYQIIAGVIEERGIEVMFKNNKAICSLLTFIVRTSNTFIGSLLWVDYLRLIGLQKGSGH